MQTEPSTAITSAVDRFHKLVQECIGQVVELNLGWSNGQWSEAAPTSDGVIVHMPLCLNDDWLHFTIQFSEQDCETLSRAMLFLEDDDEIPDDLDPADTLCELTNLVAGMLKKRLTEHGNEVRIGLPVLAETETTCETCCDQMVAQSTWAADALTAQLTVTCPDQ